MRLKLVPSELCTDNAAMIGSAARFAEPDRRIPDYLGYDAFATASGGMTEVVVYSRPAATSARRRREAIVALHASGHRFELREVDIESDDELLRGYLERIPVVEVDGDVVSELILDAGDARSRARLDTVRR